MDDPTLAPIVEPTGQLLIGDDLTRALVLFEDDDQRDAVGVEEIESYEANGIATAAFRSPLGLIVGVRRFTHTAQQIAEAESLRAKYQEDGIVLANPVANIVGPGELVTTVALYRDYPAEEAAVQDARRLLLRSVLVSNAQRQATGWRTNIVVLARGFEYYNIFRTHADGTIDIEYAENPLNAYAYYQSAVEKLVNDLVNMKWEDSPLQQTDLVTAWLRREAADALLAQARSTLSGRLFLFGLQDESVSISELARSLHTDRANLSRMITKAKREHADELKAIHDSERSAEA